MPLSFIPGKEYCFAPITAATNNGVPIDIDAENKAASAFILKNKAFLLQQKFQIIIVPGYTPVKATAGIAITDRTKKRLDNAIKVMEKKNVPIIVSGGNAHPEGTPYNEAYGMKQYLLSKGVNEELIAIDPYARHSTTNLRNCGRFMLAHKLSTAMVITSLGQSFYFSNNGMSGFRHRCKKELGYVIGKLSFLTPIRTKYLPSQVIFTKGTDPLDP